MNGTNGTVVFRCQDEGRTWFHLHVALHRWYHNVHVAAKVSSTYSQKICISERGYVHEA